MMLTKRSRPYVLLVCFIPLLGNTLYAQSENQNELLSQTSEAAGLMVNYRQDIKAIEDFYSPVRQDYFSRRSFNTVQHSPEQMLRLREVNEAYLKQVKSKSFTGISVNGKVDLLLLKRDIESKIRLLGIEENEYQQISKYIPFAEEIYALEKGRRRGASVDGQQIAGLYNDMAPKVIAAEAMLGKVPSMDMKLSDRLKKSIEGLKIRLKSILLSFFSLL